MHCGYIATKSPAKKVNTLRDCGWLKPQRWIASGLKLYNFFIIALNNEHENEITIRTRFSSILFISLTKRWIEEDVLDGKRSKEKSSFSSSLVLAELIRVLYEFSW